MAFIDVCDSFHVNVFTSATVDDLIDRFGSDVVVRASDLSHPGTVSKNGVNLDFLDYRDGERVSAPEHPD